MRTLGYCSVHRQATVYKERNATNGVPQKTPQKFLVDAL